jgi:anti-sigma regulatory factor (Ser/Thr protein kinase)
MLLIRYVDIPEALGRSALSAVLIAPTVWVGGRLRRRFPGAAPAVLIGMALTQGWGQSRLGDAVFGELETLSHPGVTVLAALWLVELVVATATISAARRQRDHIRSQLLDLLGPRGVRDAVSHGLRAVEGREFALFLHGHLQNRLTAAAQRLERTSDAAERRMAMASVLEILDEADGSTPVELPLAARLDEVTQRWRGLADLEIALDATLATLTDDVAERVVNIVVEAITNAMRHGVAQRIVVAVDPSRDGGVTIVVTDDGFGPRRGKPGTGSRYLDIVTAGHWTLTTVPEGGARLTARLDHALT